MANKGFKTLPGTVEIPTSLSTFKTKPQAVWTGSRWRSKGTFSPTHGDTSSWPGSSSYAIERQGSLYLPSQTSGLRIGTTSGEAHTQNFEIYIKELEENILQYQQNKNNTIKLKVKLNEFIEI